MANKFMTLEGRERWRMVIEIPPKELGGDQVEIFLEGVIHALLNQVSPILRKTDYFVQLAPHMIEEDLDNKGKLFSGGGRISGWSTLKDGKTVKVSNAHLAISATTLRNAKNRQVRPELTFFGLISHELFELDNLIVYGIKTATPASHPAYNNDPSELLATDRELRFLGQQFGGDYYVKDWCIVVPV